MSKLHTLSNIDRKNSTADCVLCGDNIAVVIYGTRITYRVWRLQISREAQARWRAKNPPKRNDPVKRDRMRAYHLWRSYQMTTEQWQDIFNRQNNCCAICETTNETVWHVDHDHRCCDKIPTCGKCTRGILCHNCNRALGMLKDDSENLLRAYNYLVNQTNY